MIIINEFLSINKTFYDNTNKKPKNTHNTKKKYTKSTEKKLIFCNKTMFFQ